MEDRKERGGEIQIASAIDLIVEDSSRLWAVRRFQNRRPGLDALRKVLAARGVPPRVHAKGIGALYVRYSTIGQYSVRDQLRVLIDAAARRPDR